MNASKRNYLRFLFAPIFLLCVWSTYAQTNCDNDLTPPTVACQDSFIVIAHPVNGYTVTPDILNEGSNDNCTLPENLEFRVEFAADYTGTPPSTTEVTLPPTISTEVVILWVGDEAGNWNSCWSLVIINQISSIVEGQIFMDDNGNCSLDAAEEDSGLEGWTVQATNLNTGGTYSTTTGPEGSYLIQVPNLEPGETGDILVELVVPVGITPTCSTLSTLPNTDTGVNLADFPIVLADNCQLLSVDVGASFLRRCSDNTFYVNYCNYSSSTIEDAEVTINFDSGLDVTDASLAFSILSNQSISFDVGDVPPAFCGTFTIDFFAGCELAIGKTECVTATIQPYDCSAPGPGWSGGSLEVTGKCDEENEEVIFTVKNTGTGDINEPLKYEVVEDVVMYMDGVLENDLLAGDSIVFPFVADGSTWHFSIQQTADHPGMSMPIAFVEGCNGLTPGIVNQFSMDDADPNISTSCLVVQAPFDPNDKQAFPRGYSEEHFISQNEPIEYMIRFQNTGTDTAFNVVLEDQLSEWLDPATLRTGTSSHPYHAQLSEEGLLKFYFDDIMLPDSNVNEPASHGFVKFWIQQQLDNPIGTIIDNTASIYFDFNDAIVTNTVMHTVGEAFVLVNTNREYIPDGLHLTVHPNPFAETAYFNLGEYEVRSGQFQLLDAQGIIVRNQYFQGNGFEFQRDNLVSGLYYYRITEDGKQLVSGKVVVR